jgi:hypothetical protein
VWAMKTARRDSFDSTHSYKEDQRGVLVKALVGVLILEVVHTIAGHDTVSRKAWSFLRRHAGRAQS